MAPFRFVQLSDVHLGAHPFARHPLLSDLTPARIAALHTAFDTAVSCAKENVVDAILIPGDLFDAADPPDDPLNAAIARGESMHTVLSGWRAERFGPALERALAGGTTVRLDDGALNLEPAAS